MQACPSCSSPTFMLVCFLRVWASVYGTKTVSPRTLPWEAKTVYVGLLVAPGCERTASSSKVAPWESRRWTLKPVNAR